MAWPRPWQVGSLDRQVIAHASNPVVELNSGGSLKPVRRQRVSALLRLEIARILQHELKDPRIGFLSVLSVEPTEDLKEAVVRVSLMGSPSQQRTTMRGLEAARPFIQAKLGDRVQFRNTPYLKFVQDESIKKSMDLENLIQLARAEDQAAAETRSRRAPATEPQASTEKEVDGSEEGSTDSFR
jgi:ribosome-binding factor A